jgi:adenylate cyclase
VAKLQFKLKSFIPVAIPVLAAAVATAAMLSISFIHQAELFIRDFETAVLSPPEPQSTDIVIATFTEQTLKQFPYREPVDRKFLADLLRKLEAWKPRVIALDVLFDQPTDPVKDEELRTAIANLSVPIVVSYVDEVIETVDPEQEKFLNAFVPPEDRVLADIPTDPFDGTARWLEPGHIEPDGSYIPGFARGLLKKIGIETPAEKVEIAWRGRLDNQHEPFGEISADSIVNFPPAVADKFLKQKVAGKIVLVGADMTLRDRLRTPFATIYAGNRGLLPGIVIHAHGVDQLLTGHRPPGLGTVVDFCTAVLLAAIGAALGLSKISLHWRVVLGTVGAAVWWLGGAALFHYTGFMLAIVTPSISMATSMWGTEAIMGHEARKEKAFIQGAFSRYLSPKVVNQLVQDPSKLSLEGERRMMTYLFTDVAGFTTMSEAVGGSKLARVLNAYLDGMVRVIQEKHDGLVDKFIGDAVFAIFNTPLDQPDHWERAVRCALDLDRFAEQFRAEQNAAAVPFGVTRIGVHSGMATVGNFGSHERTEYTALGDAVNTASRLEGLNKYFGTRLCVSEVTFAQCKGIAFRPMGRVIVKGKTQALAVYEPLSEERDASEYMARYRRAYQRLEAGAEDALALFEQLHAENPYDGCVEVHLERLRAGTRSPEIAMTEK